MAKLYYLDEVNNFGYGEFTDIFGNIVEHCPVIAAAVWSRRPFSDFRSIEKAFCDVLGDLPGCGKYFFVFPLSTTHNSPTRMDFPLRPT